MVIPRTDLDGRVHETSADLSAISNKIHHLSAHRPSTQTELECVIQPRLRIRNQRGVDSLEVDSPVRLLQLGRGGQLVDGELSAHEAIRLSRVAIEHVKRLFIERALGKFAEGNLLEVVQQVEEPERRRLRHCVSGEEAESIGLFIEIPVLIPSINADQGKAGRSFFGENELPDELARTFTELVTALAVLEVWDVVECTARLSVLTHFVHIAINASHMVFKMFNLWK